jgi:DNA ligase (NAD+)
MGEKSAANIIKSLNDSFKIPYHKVLFALGIRHVGETVAKILAREFSSVDDLIAADIEKLTNVREIGPKIAGSIVGYFLDRENIEIISRLRSYGLTFEEKSEPVVSTGLLAGKSIVISGVFTRHSREEYKEIIEKHGGKNSSSVSGATSFVLAGENIGPAKLEKAAGLGIEIMDESAFLRLIGEE